jgi:protein TonB
MLKPARHQRVLLISLVVAAHAALLTQWESAPPSPEETTILASLVLTDAPVHVTPVPPNLTTLARSVATIPSPLPTPSLAEATPVATPSPAVAIPQLMPQNTQPAQSPQAISSPVGASPPDHEPDYRAAYLNNPAPSYPNMAVRMGWQGKVIVNVEVLATGLAGQVSVHRSSGHQALDEAALQAVRNWRFIPARQNGQLISKAFLVPIPFTLKDNDE